MIVKEKDEITKVTKDEYQLAPKSTIQMSKKLVRLGKGEVIAAIPQKWSLIEPASPLSNEIKIIAVDENYSLSAVFSEVYVSSDQVEKIKNEGNIALANYSIFKQQSKANSPLSVLEQPKILNLQNQTFAVWVLQNSEGLLSHNANFISTDGNFYQFSITQMNFTNFMASEKEIHQYFIAILLSIRY